MKKIFFTTSNKKRSLKGYKKYLKANLDSKTNPKIKTNNSIRKKDKSKLEQEEISNI